MFRAKFTHNPESLSWYGRRFDTANLELLSTKLKNNITTLDIRYPTIPSMKAFLEVISQHHLKSLTIAHFNKLEAVIHDLILFIEKNNSLQELRLVFCEMTTNSAKKILQALSHPSLVTIDLSNNKISNEIFSVFPGLGKKVFFLESLSLKANLLTETELSDIQNIVKQTCVQSKQNYADEVRKVSLLPTDLENIIISYEGIKTIGRPIKSKQK